VLVKMFDTLGFEVCLRGRSAAKTRDFSKAISKTGSGDVWMSYVLDKIPVK